PGGTSTDSSASSSWCSTFPGSSTFPGVQRCREGVPGLAGRGEHWLVHFIELVLDVPGKLDVPGSSTLLGGCSGGCLGGASTGSSTSTSWCSTFPGSSTFPGVQRYWE